VAGSEPDGACFLTPAARARLRGKIPRKRVHRSLAPSPLLGVPSALGTALSQARQACINGFCSELTRLQSVSFRRAKGRSWQVTATPTGSLSRQGALNDMVERVAVLLGTVQFRLKVKVNVPDSVNARR
jgi:hypothetical protein